MTVLRVDEWQGASKHWYVADIYTWTGWKELADVLGAGSLDEFKDTLVSKYKADIYADLYRNGEISNVMFSWTKDNYKNAHQFKLDVNRIARNKKYEV